MTLATHFLSKNILLVWWLLVLSVAKILSWVQVTPPLTLFRYSLSFCTSRSDKWTKMHQSLLPPVLVLKSVLNFLFCLIGERAKRATIQWQFFVHLWNLDLKCECLSFELLTFSDRNNLWSLYFNILNAENFSNDILLCDVILIT